MWLAFGMAQSPYETMLRQRKTYRSSYEFVVTLTRIYMN